MVGVLLLFIGVGVVLHHFAPAVARLDAWLSQNPADSILKDLDCRAGAVTVRNAKRVRVGNSVEVAVTARYSGRSTAGMDATERNSEGDLVCSRLTARLSGSGFAVTPDPAFPETQLLSSDGTAEWRWQVTPLSSRGEGLDLLLWTSNDDGSALLSVASVPVLKRGQIAENSLYRAAGALRSIGAALDGDAKWLLALLGGAVVAVVRPFRLAAQQRMSTFHAHRVARARDEAAALNVAREMDEAKSLSHALPKGSSKSHPASAPPPSTKLASWVDVPDYDL